MYIAIVVPGDCSDCSFSNSYCRWDECQEDHCFKVVEGIGAVEVKTFSTTSQCGLCCFKPISCMGQCTTGSYYKRY